MGNLPKMKTRNLIETLERIVPDEIDTTDDFGLESLRLHIERYEFAKNLIVPGRLLDIACGCGYGSYHLITGSKGSIREIVGIDISEQAIAYARRRYGHPLIKFIQADIQQLFDTSANLRVASHSVERRERLEQVDVSVH